MSKALTSVIEDDSAFLLSFADDTEESPWMVVADPHFLALLALVGPAQVYAAEHRPDLSISAELAVRFPKVNGKMGQVAPDMFAAYAPRRLRSSFDVASEGSFPAFVLEVVSPESVGRDTREKPRLYGLVGAQEYVIFNPLGEDGRQLSGYHRDGRGEWVRWPGGQRGVLFSEVLGLTLEAQDMLLRLRDRSGMLLPTLQEAHDARAAEARRAEAETRRAEAETRRAGAAEARVMALEAELARLRRGS
ncbi:MAG TPA: Uma2 family endonuclease [Chloroflexota bacterium]|nr:Uma2 family endonuclease [Chloroflexota bacterium]